MRMERATGTHVETIEFSPDQARAWQLPAFQRPLNVNPRVRAIADQIKSDGGVVPGVLCFGVCDKKTYLIDGQQRREAFLLSGAALGYADARYVRCETMAEMAREFVNLNSHLVAMRPDDILRGLEPVLPAMQKIRKRCPFVGYDMVRRGAAAPVLSMSVAIRCWTISAPDVPGGTTPAAAVVAERFTDHDADEMSAFLNLCLTAWGRDPEYSRLWLALNLVLCAWLYRRLVLTTYSGKTQRMSPELFTKCLMSLSADSTYIDWLQGRRLCERDRSPAYARIKALLAKRLQLETGHKPYLPAPAWTHGTRR